jgi:hypothetical protein
MATGTVNPLPGIDNGTSGTVEQADLRISTRQVRFGTGEPVSLPPTFLLFHKLIESAIRMTSGEPQLSITMFREDFEIFRDQGVDLGRFAAIMTLVAGDDADRLRFG